MQFTIDVLRVIFSEYRLKKDGSFGKINTESAKKIKNDDFIFDDYFKAKNWKREQDFIEVNGERVKVNPVGIGVGDYYVSITPHRISKPKQNYITIDQLESALVQGDDSQNNALVIDFDGYLQLKPFEEAIKSAYAVRYESFQAGNGYVGRTSSLNHLNRTYQALLQGWANHLAGSEQIYRDYAENKSEEETINDILRYIKQYK